MCRESTFMGGLLTARRSPAAPSSDGSTGGRSAATRSAAPDGRSTASSTGSTSSSATRRASASAAGASSSTEAISAPSAEVRQPLLLGESPSARGDRYHAFPLSGAPAKRLLECMMVSYCGPAYWELVEHFETLNVMERYRDSSPWSVVRARERWGRWIREEGIQEEYRRPPGDPRPPFVVVCVGRRAAEAVGLSPSRPWFDWCESGTLAAVVVPHTSGRNRLNNEDRTATLTGTVLHEAIRKAGRPCAHANGSNGVCGGRHCPACGPDYKRREG